MRSQPPASRQSPDREPDGELHGHMDDYLAVEVAADQGRNERRLLPVIGAVWARTTYGGGLRGRLSRAIASTKADASRRSFGNGNDDRRRVWCGAKRFDKIPTGGGWYGGGNIDGGGRVCGCIGLRASGSPNNRVLTATQSPADAATSPCHL
ncbi:hypothetical protein V6N12_009287 [Hibiscus sabdariffa]|uniref:Uncharacterized protein n=1 Tax=Hibiscus sabdariffa TaxID=183260 RepID=A0ABR2AQS2_9ROSI